MACTSPRTVSFDSDGVVTFRSKDFNKEYATFQLPCGKCLECRLDYARQWAIRCVHEAQMHDRNSFITLTYNEQSLSSPKLVYSDFQKFMKRLRKLQNDPIGLLVTGEYGEKTKRPHWHAIIFNWRPLDASLKYTSDRGDRVYTSPTLEKTWGLGNTEFGEVTFLSAGYVARYAAKKLVHGYDQDHDYHPISKKSQKHAIGKKWLERYWPDVFNQGKIILPDGNSCPIPRYYEKWFKENHPNEYFRYLTKTKQENLERAQKRAALEEAEQATANNARRLRMLSNQAFYGRQTSPLEARRAILKSKFKMLQDYLKL